MPIIQPSDNLGDRDPTDFFPTPEGLVQAIVDISTIADTSSVLDVGAGFGIFGRTVRSKYPNSHIVGVELDEERFNYPEGYDEHLFGDFLTYTPEEEFDVVIGNPPFYIDAEVIRHGMEQLKVGGQMIYLLRLGLQCGQRRWGLVNSNSADADLWLDMPPHTVRQLPRRPSFHGNMKTDATEYGVFIWEKGVHTDGWWNTPLMWDYSEADRILAGHVRQWEQNMKSEGLRPRKDDDIFDFIENSRLVWSLSP